MAFIAQNYLSTTAISVPYEKLFVFLLIILHRKSFFIICKMYMTLSQHLDLVVLVKSYAQRCEKMLSQRNGLVKCLFQRCQSNQSGAQGVSLSDQVDHLNQATLKGLASIDEISLPGKSKLQCLQFWSLPHPTWPSTVQSTSPRSKRLRD